MDVLYALTDHPWINVELTQTGGGSQKERRGSEEGEGKGEGRNYSHMDEKDGREECLRRKVCCHFKQGFRFAGES